METTRPKGGANDDDANDGEPQHNCATIIGGLRGGNAVNAMPALTLHADSRTFGGK